MCDGVYKKRLIEAKSLFENEDGTMSFIVACSYCNKKCRAYVTIPADIDDDKLYTIKDRAKPCAYREIIPYWRSVRVSYLSLDENAPGSDNYLSTPITRPYFSPCAGTRYTFTCNKCKDKRCTVETSNFTMPTNCMIGTASKKVAYVREDIYEIVEEKK